MKQASVLLVLIISILATALVVVLVLALLPHLVIVAYGVLAACGMIGLIASWFVLQHRLEDLRTKRAIRQFHEEKSAALAHAKETKANYKVGADQSLEVIHWHRASQTTTVIEEEEEQKTVSPPAPKELPTLIRYEDIKPYLTPGQALVGVSARGVETKSNTVRACIWVVGGSGTGKSNTVALRVDDDYQSGHQLLLADPHAFKEDSLTNSLAGYAERFLLPVAQEAEDIMQMLDFFLTEFRARRSGQRWDAPITLIVDEVGALSSDIDKDNSYEVAVAAKLKEVARICGQEARGFDMRGIFISQDAAGLAWLRKRALMVLAHQVLMWSERLLACNQNTEVARQMDTWPKGRTLAYGIAFSEGPIVVQQPLFAPGVGSSQMSSNPSSGRSREVAWKVTGSLVEDTGEHNAFELKKMLAEIGKMKAAGMSNDAILKRYGLAPGGRNNQNLKAATEVIAALESEA